MPYDNAIFVWLTILSVQSPPVKLFLQDYGLSGRFLSCTNDTKRATISSYQAGTCQLDSAQAIKSVTQAASMPIAVFDQHYHSHFAAIFKVLNFNKSSICLKSDTSNHCDIAQLTPTHIEFDKYHMLKIKGA